MSELDSEFAVCANSIGSCECPAVTAGYDPMEDESVEIAEMFDYYCGGEERTVSEVFARDNWMRAIDEAERSGQIHAARIGRDIARRLGWLDAR